MEENVMSIKGNYEDFLHALGYRESGGRYNIENQFGYLGKYQMGEMALKDAGYYKGDPTRKNDWIGEWTGKDGVWSKEDFLNNPAAQENAIREFHRKMWSYIKAAGLHRYIGRTIGGVQITESGLLGGAHLLGVGGLRKFILSGGRQVPRDGNGTPISEYMRKFAGYDISEITNTAKPLTEKEKEEFLKELEWDVGEQPKEDEYQTTTTTTQPSKTGGDGGIIGIITGIIKAIFSIFKK